jgi:hypothetical protein
LKINKPIFDWETLTIRLDKRNDSDANNDVLINAFDNEDKLDDDEEKHDYEEDDDDEEDDE